MGSHDLACKWDHVILCALANMLVKHDEEVVQQCLETVTLLLAGCVHDHAQALGYVVVLLVFLVELDDGLQELGQLSVQLRDGHQMDNVTDGLDHSDTQLSTTEGGWVQSNTKGWGFHILRN